MIKIKPMAERDIELFSLLAKELIDQDKAGNEVITLPLVIGQYLVQEYGFDLDEDIHAQLTLLFDEWAKAQGCNPDQIREANRGNLC
jgi:hypothetical protein